MIDETLATVAEDLEDITIESNENSVFDGAGNSWSVDNPLPVQVVSPSDSSEDFGDSEVETQYLGEEIREDPIVLEDIHVYSASRSRTVSSDFHNQWKLEISGQVYNVLFPSNASLAVVDGRLYNTGSSNITGIVLDSSFSDSSFSDYFITVLPVTSSSTQNTVYRYGSRIYLTHYSVSATGGLSSTVSYVQPSVSRRPVGFTFTAPDLVICGLLLLSCLISIVGGLFRR